MSSNYQGLASNITSPLAATISGVLYLADGTVKVQTSSAHLFATGDIVTITGVGGAVTANTGQGQVWQITVVDATHFILNGSYGTVAYTSGGTAHSFGLLPFFQQPSDGEPGTVASILAAIEALADRSQFLDLFLPRGGSTIIYEALNGVNVESQATWTQLTSMPAAWTAIPISNWGLIGPGVQALCNDGDLFEVMFTTSSQTSTQAAELGLGSKIMGVAANALTIIPGSGQVVQATAPVGVYILGSMKVAANGSTASITAKASTNVMTVTGLSGIGTGIAGSSITISGAASAGNNGTFYIPPGGYISSSSVQYINTNGVAGDANNGAISWSLQNMPWDFQAMGNDYPGGGTNSILLRSSYQMRVRQQRGTQNLAKFPYFNFGGSL